MSSNYDAIYKYLSSKGSQSLDNKITSQINEVLLCKKPFSLPDDDIIHIYRILLKIGSRCHTAIDYNAIIDLFSLCICNPFNNKDIENIVNREIIMLGKVLLMFIRMINSNYNNMDDITVFFKDCEISLPISNIKIQPNKFVIVLDEPIKLIKLFSIWCSIIDNCIKYNKIVNLKDCNDIILEGTLLICKQSTLSKFRIGVQILFEALNVSNKFDINLYYGIYDQFLDSIQYLIRLILFSNSSSINIFMHMNDICNLILKTTVHINNNKDLIFYIYNKVFRLISNDIVESLIYSIPKDVYIQEEFSLIYDIINKLNTILLTIVKISYETISPIISYISISNLIKLITSSNLHLFYNVLVRVKQLQTNHTIIYSNCVNDFDELYNKIIDKYSNIKVVHNFSCDVIIYDIKILLILLDNVNLLTINDITKHYAFVSQILIQLYSNVLNKITIEDITSQRYDLDLIMSLLQYILLNSYHNINCINELNNIIKCILKSNILKKLQGITFVDVNPINTTIWEEMFIVSKSSLVNKGTLRILKLLCTPVKYQFDNIDKLLATFHTNYIPLILQYINDSLIHFNKNVTDSSIDISYSNVNKLLISSIQSITLMFGNASFNGPNYNNNLLITIGTITDLSVNVCISLFKNDSNYINLLLYQDSCLLQVNKIVTSYSNNNNNNRIVSTIIAVYFKFYLTKHNILLDSEDDISTINKNINDILECLKSVQIYIDRLVVFPYDNNIELLKLFVNFRTFSIIVLLINRFESKHVDVLSFQNIDNYIISIYINMTTTRIDIKHSNEEIKLISKYVELIVMNIAFEESLSKSYNDCDVIYQNYVKLFPLNLTMRYDIIIKTISNVLPICAFISPKIFVYMINYLVKIWIYANKVNDDSSMSTKASIYDAISILSQSEILGIFINRNMEYFSNDLILTYIKSNINNSEFQSAVEIISHIIRLARKSSDISKGVDALLAQKLMICVYFTCPSSSNKLKLFFPDSIHGIDNQKQVLLERTHLIYEILTSEYIQQYNIYDLIHGEFYILLKKLSKLFNLKFSSENRDNNILNNGVIQRTLVHLTWDLGYGQIKKEQTKNALLIFCSLCKYHLWSIPKVINGVDKKKFSHINLISQDDFTSEDMEDDLFQDDNKTITIKLDINKNLSEVLADNFLYINSRFQANWSSKSCLEQTHSIRVMKEIIDLLSINDILKYIPKINIIANISVFSSYSMVQSIGLDICKILFNKMKISQLNDHLSVLVVPIFDLVDKLKLKMSQNINSNIIQINQINSSESILTGKLFSNTDLFVSFRQPVYHLPSLLLELFECLSFPVFTSRYDISTYSNAISILNDVFVNKIAESDKVLTTIPYIPEINELESIVNNQRKTLSKLSLNELFQLYQLLLKHELIIVRLKSLEKLYDLIQNNIQELLNNEKVIKNLIIDLFQICIHEKDSNVLNLVSKCLGSMGAIDPSRLSIGKIYKTNINDSNSVNNDQPWEFTIEDMSLNIIEVYLLPSLRSNSTIQSHTGYALQCILQILSNKITNNANSNEQTKMPDKMFKLLDDRKIFELLEPFWLSKYVLKTNDITPNQLNSTIYGHNITYTKWISSWIKKLMYICDGKTMLSQIYQSCRGAVMLKNDLCTFLLPRVVVDALIISREDKNTKMNVFSNILQEILCVLNGRIVNLDNYNDNDVTVQIILNENDDSLCVQSIFNLLDILNKWLTKSLINSSKHSRNQLVNNDDDIVKIERTVKISNNPAKLIEDNIHNGLYRNVLFSIQNLLHCIPLSLQSRAAYRIKAYSRSLRLIEMFHDQQNLYHKFKSQNFLPLDEINLNKSMQILSKLEDRDAIKGCLNLKYIYGYNCTSHDKIVESELNDDWMTALLEYGQIDRLDGKSKLFVEKGRLRCLMELGHLDAVIDQSTAYQQNPVNFKYNPIPLGIEASWKLSKWDQLDNFIIDSANNPISYDIEDTFQINIGKAFSYIKNKNMNDFNTILRDSRLQVMLNLSASCQESYSRTYPSLVKLHILHELESAVELINHSDYLEYSSEHLEKSFNWGNRLEMMSPSLRQQNTVLAVQRSILSLYNMKDMLSNHWLSTCQTMRMLRHYDSAMLALYQAKLNNLPISKSLIEECKILKDSGQTAKALILIEPVELDVLAIRNTCKLSLKNQTNLPIYLNSQDKRLHISEKLHLATDILVETKQKLGQAIINRYKCVIDLKENVDMCKIHYDIAKYYDELYVSSLTSAEAALFSATEVTSTNKTTSVTSTSTSINSENSSNVNLYINGGNYHFLLKTIDHYSKSVVAGDKYLLQALPRLITVWLAYTSLRDSNDINNKVIRLNSKIINHSTSSTLKFGQSECNNFMNKISSRLTIRSWYTVLTQLVSRTGHQNDDSLKIVKKLITEIVIAFPQQSIWFITGLMNSLNSNRREIGLEIYHNACKQLNNNVNMFSAIQTTASLCQRLVDVAVFQTKDKQMQFKLPQDFFKSQNVLIPIQCALLNTYPHNSSTMPKNGIVSTSNQLFMIDISPVVTVATSKAKPKTITVLSLNKSIKFLVKQERNGDLRKDARMMEFNNVVNRIFVSSYEGRSRHLRLRTFAVICLNEECGILEWVDNTTCIRHLIIDSHNYYHNLANSKSDNINEDNIKDNKYNIYNLYPSVNFREIHQPFMDMQKKYEFDIINLVNEYRLLITNKYRPCLHRWFLESFQDPTEWYETRVIFIRSLAVWSIVGYIIGLGDRHTENILCDITNGEIVHVDFDCLFDKGLTLLKPEIVPFRLTSNLIDVMGFSGIEGIFKQTLEITMTLLQENKTILMSILEPFLRDPTVAWSRSGRAQQLSQTSNNLKSKIEFQDLENKDAKDTLLKILGRLNGMYNIVHPYSLNIQKAYKQRKETLPSKGLGALPDEIFPLSIPGQIQRLIEEATCEENLSQMYVGWQPWA